MATTTTEFDLASLLLRSGEARRLELAVDPGAIVALGQTLVVQDVPVPTRLEVSRSTTGFALRLSFSARLGGDCVRCLGPSVREISLEAREIEDLVSNDEEMRSPYVEDQILDLAAWAHDVVMLEMPRQFLCGDDCRGLCETCGSSLNGSDGAAHRHDGDGDPRFAKLGDLVE